MGVQGIRGFNLWHRGGGAPASAATAAYAANGFNPEFALDYVLNQYFSEGAAVSRDTATTYTGASLSTMVDSDGLLKWTPHNLITYSEDFANAAWIPVNGTKTGNLITATAADGKVQQNVTVPAGSTLVAYVIKGTADVVQIDNGISGANDKTDFNLSTVSFTLRTNNDAASITDVGGGIFKLTVTRKTTVSAGNRISISPLVNGETVTWSPEWHLYNDTLGGMVNNPDRSDSYVPTTSAAVYMQRIGNHVYNGTSWVNEGSLVESAAATNLLTHSNDFTNATWSESNTLRTDSMSTSPSGLTDAWAFESGALTNGLHQVFDIGNTITSGVPYTASCFVKYAAGEVAWAALNVYDGTDNRAWFNISTGAKGTNGAGVTSTIVDVGGGWYRLSATLTVGSTSGGMSIEMSTADNTPTSVITTGLGMFTYGAQFELGSTPSSYIPTDAGATVTRSAQTLAANSAALPAFTTGVSIVMLCRAAWPNGANLALFEWELSGLNNIYARVDSITPTLSSFDALVEGGGININANGSSGFGPAYDANTPAGYALRATLTETQCAYNGTSEAAGTGASRALPDLSATDIRFFENNVTGSFNGNVKHFVVWGEDIAQVGIEEASAIRLFTIDGEQVFTSDGQEVFVQL